MEVEQTMKVNLGSWQTRLRRVKYLYLIVGTCISCGQIQEAAVESPACSEERRVLRLQLHTGEHINRSQSGQSLPVRVTVIQSESSLLPYVLEKALQPRDIRDVEEVLDTQTVTLYPNDEFVLEVPREDASGVVAVAAEVRAPRGVAWFDEVELDSDGSCQPTSVTSVVNLDEVRVSMTPFRRDRSTGND